MSTDESRAPARAGASLPPREGQHREEPPELREGEMIDGRYRVERAIGEGGVGRVYRALQVKLDRPVAIKVLLDASLGDEDQRPRFEREAMALASLSHPHIVSVQDYGVWRGRPFLVMEMLQGQSLRQRLDLSPLSEREALRITRDLLHALAYAHAKGVIHRDLKPGNIFLQSFPTQLDHVKILDFGFAKFVDNNALARAPALTVAGTTVGTPAYLSPERLYAGPVDGRSDLYSVGIVLFEMLSGKKPFDGEISDILQAHLSAPVPRLSDRCAALGQSDALTQLLERALHKDPEGRYPDAGAMLTALAALPQPATFPAGSQASRGESKRPPQGSGQPRSPDATVRQGLGSRPPGLLRAAPTRDSLRRLGDRSVHYARLAAARLWRWLALAVGARVRRLREGPPERDGASGQGGEAEVRSRQPGD